MIELVCRRSGQTVGVKYSTFPGGEEYVKIEGKSKEYKVFAQIQNSSDLMRLFLLNNAIAAQGATADLFIPYFPYARQDRICNLGESHSMFAMGVLFSAMRWGKVVYIDPHSDVVQASVGGEYREQDEVMSYQESLVQFMDNNNVTLISPDAGALKKIYKVSKFFGAKPVIKADKTRNIHTGEIEGVEVHAETLDPDEQYLIVDDICDGGRTFIELAKELQFKGAKHISLYVTHGIFSKGFGVFEGLFENIFTTNSWTNRLPLVYNGVTVHTLNLFNTIFKEI